MKTHIVEVLSSFIYYDVLMFTHLTVKYKDGKKLTVYGCSDWGSGFSIEMDERTIAWVEKKAKLRVKEKNKFLLGATSACYQKLINSGVVYNPIMLTI